MHIDHELVEKTEKWKIQLIALAKEKLKRLNEDSVGVQLTEIFSLQSLIRDICPECGMSLFVMESVYKKSEHYFKYGCGHELTIKDEKIFS